MTTTIARASKALKGSTSIIRQHLDAVDRAREVYLAGMKRLEADYFERIKRATEIVTGSGDETSKATSETIETAPPPAS